MAPPGVKKKKDLSPGSGYSLLADLEGYPELDGKRKKRNEIQTNSFFNRNTTILDSTKGPKFILIKRNGNPGQTMDKISPFTIKKTIDQFAGSPKSIRRLQDGSLLVETTTHAQAEKMYKMEKMNDIQITVSEHPTLNTSKGTVYCRDFNYLSDDEILAGLEETNQHVKEIVRLKRKINNELVDSGLYIVTFNLPIVPTTLYAGFIALPVRIYIPNPRRCQRCQRYGHGKNHCKSKYEYCGKCAVLNHSKETCTSTELNCSNCEIAGHAAWDRECAVFKREKEIMTIQTVDRISNYEARKKYRNTHPEVHTNQTTAYNKTSSHEANAMSLTQTHRKSSPTATPTASTSTLSAHHAHVETDAVKLSSIPIETTKPITKDNTINKTTENQIITDKINEKSNNQNTFNKEFKNHTASEDSESSMNEDITENEFSNILLPSQRKNHNNTQII